MSTFLGFRPMSFASSQKHPADAAAGQQADSPPQIGGAAGPSTTAAQQQQQQQQQRHKQQLAGAGAPAQVTTKGPAAPDVPSGTAEIQRLTDQYSSEAARLAEQLSLCGIQQQSLSEEAQGSLALLAQLASMLQLAQAKPQLVLAAWALLLVQESKATVLQHTLQQELAALGQQRARARQKLALLHKVLADVQGRQAREAARAQDKAKLTDQMLQKDVGYTAMIGKQGRRLEQNGFRPEITHGALLAQHSQLQALQQQLADLQAQLGGYHQLPATLLGARMRLQDAKQKLEEKHARFQSQLADTH